MALSFALIPAELDILSPIAFKTFAILRRHANYAGQVRIGQRKLAELVGTSAATVNRAIKELVRRRTLVQSAPRRMGATCAYQIDFRYMRPERSGDETPCFTHETTRKESLSNDRDKERGAGATTRADRPEPLAAPAALRVRPATPARERRRRLPSTTTPSTAKNPLPADWAPSDDDFLFVLERNSDVRWIDQQTQLFIATQRANGTLKADWSWAYRGWFIRDDGRSIAWKRRHVRGANRAA
jgi:hypothetical protein